MAMCVCVYVHTHSHFQRHGDAPTPRLQGRTNAGGLCDTWDIQKSPQKSSIKDSLFTTQEWKNTMRASFVSTEASQGRRARVKIHFQPVQISFPTNQNRIKCSLEMIWHSHVARRIPRVGIAALSQKKKKHLNIDLDVNYCDNIRSFEASKHSTLL